MTALPLSAVDVVHRIDEEPLEGEVLKIGDNEIVVKAPTKSRGGPGYEVVKVSIQELKFIDFQPVEGERAVLLSGNLRELRELWDEKSNRLSLPNSNAGEVGLSLARKHLAAGGEVSASTAHLLYSRIEEEDWNIERRESARRGRLQALIALGRQEEAIKEAKLLEEEAEEPRIILDAKHVLVVADFEKLQQLIEDNPKWREDDEVHDSVLSLYHSIVDRCFQPFLFFGTNEEAAPRGLLYAARAHLLAGEPDRAKESLTDLRALYPLSPYLIDADRLISDIQNHEK
ncbi:MAG: tetratricopeptide repeat protein [Verrucomicrobiota bacterium]